MIIALGGSLVSMMQLLTYVLAHTLPPKGNTSEAVLLVVVIFQYFGVAAVSSAAFSAPVKHFPRRRGHATSLVKSFVGLGAAMVAQLFVAIFGSTASDSGRLEALLLWSATSLICTILAVLLLPGQPDPEAVEPRELLWADFVLFLCLGVLIFIVSLVPHGIAHNALVGLLLTLTLVPICLACAPCLDRPVPLAANSEARVTPLPTLETAFPFSLPQMLRTIDAWLLWWCGAVLFGGGLLLATNLSQILQSFGASTRLLPTLVTLFSNGNFLGRLVAMLISDTLVRRGLPRPWFVVADCAVAASAQLLFLLSSTLHGAAQSFVLVVSSLLGGLAFGAIWPHLVVLTSELFGSANLATNCARTWRDSWAYQGLHHAAPNAQWKPFQPPGVCCCVCALQICSMMAPALRLVSW